MKQLFNTDYLYSEDESEIDMQDMQDMQDMEDNVFKFFLNYLKYMTSKLLNPNIQNKIESYLEKQNLWKFKSYMNSKSITLFSKEKLS